MSALKVLLKFNTNKKNRHKGTSTPPFGRSSSNQQIKQFSTFNTSDPPVYDPQFRSRSKTFTGMTMTKPQEKRRLSSTDPPGLVQQPSVERVCDDDDLCLEDMQMKLTSPRHYLRRKALVQDELQNDVSSSTILRSASGLVDANAESSNFLKICLQAEGHEMTENVPATLTHSVIDLIEHVLLKHDIDLSRDLKEYSTIGTTTGHSVPVSLDRPSYEYAGYTITLTDGNLPGVNQMSDSEAPREEEKQWVFGTVQDCLDYFDEHGLVELPLPNEEESYQLPRVTPLEPLVRDWESLPIDPQTKNALSDKEMEQQRAIWELIYNEYSHLKTLETVINVFMRCLELIHRAKVFTEDNYHNIFGYMEDMYHAHDQLWTYTLEPCLTKTYETKCPLDIAEIVNRFPQSFGRHFEIYEQHCTLDSLNLSNLQKATSNAEFNTYLNWCEARSECNRQKLKEMLAKPMQQLTRYHLLINAIIKKTVIRSHKEKLEKIVEEVTSFVHVVDNGLRMQEETERVKDAMTRITSYSVGDVPSELKELVQSYTHLDLLAPMPDVELDKPRLLMVEGSLHYRDSIKPKMSAVYVFLFTDMLLITKPIRKSSTDKYKVIHAPYKITSLVVHSLSSESICCLVLSDYNVLSSWFILKANSATVAEEWLKQITAAQQFYQDAMNKKAQTWKLMENLRSERILNGVENLDSLSASLSQSLWSINSLSSNKKYEYDLSKRSSTPSLNQHMTLTKSGSCDYSSKTMEVKPRKSRYKNFRSMTGSIDLTQSLSLQRTSSLGGIVGQNPFESNRTRPSSLSGSKLLDHSYTAGLMGHRSHSRTGHVLFQENNSHGNQTVQRSPNSDSSSTEGSESSLCDAYSRDNGMAQPLDDLKSATLPRPRKHRKSIIPPMSKSLSQSPVDNDNLDFNDSNLSLKDMGSQGFSESTNPLRSLLRLIPKSKNHIKDLAISRTRSHGEVERTSRSSFSISPIPPTIEMDNSSLPQEELDTGAHLQPSVRKKFNSVGSLEAPDLNQLLRKSPELGRVKKSRNSLPSFDSMTKPGSLIGALSSSEGCLAPSSCDSYFNIVYIRDAYSRSQKPNVETVDEEEESQPKTKNDSLEETDMDISLASSSCTEVPLQKSCEELDTETEHVQSSDDAAELGEEKKKTNAHSAEENDLQEKLKNEEGSVEAEIKTPETNEMHIHENKIDHELKDTSSKFEKPESLENGSANKSEVSEDQSVVSEDPSPGVEELGYSEEEQPKVVLNIPVMAVSDVDSGEPETMTSASKAKYIFKDMREMSSFNDIGEAESDLECDQTAKDKFTLLHSWRTFESISIESDDYLSSPNSVDDLKFSTMEKKWEKKVKPSDKHTIMEVGSETSSNDEVADKKKKTAISDLLFPVPSPSPTSQDPVNSADKFVAYSPLMKKKQHTPATFNTKELGMLRQKQENGSYAKSKVKQLSKMFEVDTSAIQESSPVCKPDPGKRTTHSPSPRIKKVSSEPTPPVATSRNKVSRKESVSKIPVVGDKKKQRTLNGHVRKEIHSKSPEPSIATERLLPSKPSFRNGRSHPSEKNGAELTVSSLTVPSSKDSGPIVRVSSAPQAGTKTNPESSSAISDVQESKEKTKRSQEPNSVPSKEPKATTSSTVERIKLNGVVGKETVANGVVPRQISTSEEKKTRTMEETKMRSVSAQLKPKLGNDQLKVKRYSLPESKSKSSVQEPKGLKARSNSTQLLKSKPSRTQESRIKSGVQGELSGRGSSAPVPKPKPNRGHASKAKVSHNWELKGKSSTMESKTRTTSSKPPSGAYSSLQRLNGNHFYSRQSSAPGLVKATAAEVVLNTNNNNNDRSEHCHEEALSMNSPIVRCYPYWDTITTEVQSVTAHIEGQSNTSNSSHHFLYKAEPQSNT